eukprot:TRINITY_DN3790_c0_g1_i2.p1 TRINITY_DN3790_c0_g1~~TRINITY_DN3790_c0_g1_i2.p1  ORF type:complete len:353 (-),score=43.41 TRINITY_DN3790_c0_g1_i2:233-1291(-)
MPPGRKSSRRDADPDKRFYILLGLLVVVVIAAAVSTVYSVKGAVRASVGSSSDEEIGPERLINGGEEAEESEPEATEDVTKSCRGLQHYELWGDAIKWGDSNLVDTAEQCCQQCREMCPVGAVHCDCNSWVYCEDEELCAEKHRQCWLKKQDDVLSPEVHDSDSSAVPWTSGLLHPVGQGIIALETTKGTVRIKLHPQLAPRAVRYLRDLLAIRYCSECQFYRAEGRGSAWDSEGKRLPNTKAGPPYALVQGSFKSDGIKYVPLPKEATPSIKRGMAAIVGAGPDFIISLADHPEWGRVLTVFGEVVPDDMTVVEGLTALPTKEDVWEGVKVRVLEEELPFRLRKDTSGIKI